MSNSQILHVESLGCPGAPGIVFLHGLAGSTASWGEPFLALAVDHDLLLVDLLGFGRSPKPAIAYSVEDHLLALRRTLQQQDMPRPHLVGHSMGALLALAYAARYPNEVGRVVLLALPWFANEEEARRKISEQSLFNRWLALETPLAHLVCTVMCRIRPWLMPLMPHVLRDVPAEVARDVLRHNWLSYSRTLKHLIIGLRPAALLPQIKAPLLIVQGLKDETASAGPVALGIAGHANARLRTIDAGHHMIFTHAEELANDVRNFVSH